MLNSSCGASRQLHSVPFRQLHSVPFRQLHPVPPVQCPAVDENTCKNM